MNLAVARNAAQLANSRMVDAVGGRQQREPREMFDVTCAACGAPTQVPFRPSNDRPVYCRDCFQSNRH